MPWYLFEEALENLWRHRTAHLIAALVVSLTFFVLAGFWTVTDNIADLIDFWRREVRLEVFLEPQPSESARRQVETALQRRPEVRSLRYIDPAAANRRFREEFAALADLLKGLKRNPLPASIEALLDPAQVSAAQLDVLAIGLLEIPGVTGVQFDLDWLEKLTAALRLIRFAGLVVVITLLLTSLAATAGVIQLSVLSRRDEIEILHLIGAPPLAVGGPFLLEGLALGAVASGAGLGLFALLFHAGLAALSRSLNLYFGFLQPAFLSGAACVLLVVLGTLVGALGSLLSVHRLRPE
ncbi:MAG TPA: ABC transporter permease [Acidobacteriota bacterium]